MANIFPFGCSIAHKTYPFLGELRRKTLLIQYKGGWLQYPVHLSGIDSCKDFHSSGINHWANQINVVSEVAKGYPVEGIDTDEWNL